MKNVRIRAIDHRISGGGRPKVRQNNALSTPDSDKVPLRQFRGVCDQDCTAILLKVPSKWFPATVVGSARRVTRHMGQILPAPSHVTQREFDPLLGDSSTVASRAHFYSSMRRTGIITRAIISFQGDESSFSLERNERRRSFPRNISARA
jgi:hypothetical protein